MWRRTRILHVKGGGSGDGKHVLVVDSLDQVYSNTIWTPSKVPLLQIWTMTIIRERLLVLGGRSRSHTLDVIPWMQILTRMIWTRTMTRTRLLVLGDKGLITETWMWFPRCGYWRGWLMMRESFVRRQELIIDVLMWFPRCGYGRWWERGLFGGKRWSQALDVIPSMWTRTDIDEDDDESELGGEGWSQISHVIPSIRILTRTDVDEDDDESEAPGVGRQELITDW